MTTDKLEIISDPNQLPKVDEFAQKVAQKMGFSKEQSDDISIAVTEVVNNAIMHGNNCDPQKRVFITFYRSKSHLMVKVEDQGGGFEPDDLEDPTAPENILKGKGRGIFIVKHLMDEVNFEKTPIGMSITILKRKSGTDCRKGVA